MKRTRLNKTGKSEAAEIKREIQKTLREICLIRDGRCLVGKRRGGECGPNREDGRIIYQADHISSRANSLTYGLSENVYLICRNCHYWKMWNREKWEMIMKAELGERFDKMIKLGAEKPKSSYTAWDWHKVFLGLTAELKQLKGEVKK